MSSNPNATNLSSTLSIKETASITWTLDNFKSTNNLTWSPDFSPSTNPQTKFQLGICPKPNFAYCHDDVYAYLWYNQQEQELNIEYEVSILDAKKRKCYTKKFRWNYDLKFDHCRNVTFFISYYKLINESNGFLSNNNKLTIYCEVNAQKFKHDNILHDYESLLDNGKFADFALVIGDKVLRAHKNILAARSPVFAAMFEHEDTKEVQEGRVEIIDFSVDVCQELLRYIYTGKIPPLSEYAADLFSAADKYQLEHLKSICEQSLLLGIGTESVVNTLQLADLHNNAQLKRKCIEFITKNSNDVMQTEACKQLASCRPQLLVELYRDLSVKASPLLNHKN